MANKTINELIAATTLLAEDLLVLQQNNKAKKISGQTLINELLKLLKGQGGIKNTEFTSKDGLVDTYTITYVNDTTTTFTVTNGAKGDKGDTTYLYIRYSAKKPTNNADISNTPDDWIGIYVGKSPTAPTDYKEYLWQYVKGGKGDKGDDITIASQDVGYQASTNGTAIPAGSWLPNIPSVAQGSYLWTRIQITFSTGETINAYSTARMGIDGNGAPSDEKPIMDGTASPGVGENFARYDHVHPHDTSKQDKLKLGAALTNDVFPVASDNVGKLYTGHMYTYDRQWRPQTGYYTHKIKTTVREKGYMIIATSTSPTSASYGSSAINVRLNGNTVMSTVNDSRGSSYNLYGGAALTCPLFVNPGDIVETEIYCSNDHEKSAMYAHILSTEKLIWDYTMSK